MQDFLALIGIVMSFFMIIKREAIGNMLGEPEWMSKIGGVFAFVVYMAAFIFLWSIAELVGTSDILFKPLLWLVPGGSNWNAAPAEGF